MQFSKTYPNAADTNIEEARTWPAAELYTHATWKKKKKHPLWGEGFVGGGGGGRAPCGLRRGGVSFGWVLRFRREAAGWGAFAFGSVGVRGRKVARPPPPPPPTQKGGEEEKGEGGG